ncbi:MAG: ABC transporter ATP-binding protein [Anaerolineae bacterium]|nr:ABC transporter ATP-binding protein [Anaerolineae bacterium]
MNDLELPILRFERVTRRYDRFMALEDVDFVVQKGKILGLVGESGSGKTTCIRLALGLERPSAGRVWFMDRPYHYRPKELKSIRRRIGFIFQDPYDALDPYMTLEEIIGEPLRAHGLWDATARERVRGLLDRVGLPDASLRSYPTRYSGGGLQRIAIARALALDPELLLCDEPTSNLDVSMQAQIINLLIELQRERGLAMVFVTHDLPLIRRIADDLVVLYAGRVMERGPAREIAARPRHPYTIALLGATEARTSHRNIWDEANPLVSTGCPFASRCWKAQPRCWRERPPRIAVGPDWEVACFFPEE